LIDERKEMRVESSNFASPAMTLDPVPELHKAANWARKIGSLLKRRVWSDASDMTYSSNVSKIDV